MRIYESTQFSRLTSRHVTHTEVIEIDTPHGTIRMNTSGWDLEFNTGTSFGGGSAIKIEYPDEDMSLAAYSCRITLSSMNPAITALALSTPMANRPVRIYHAILDDDYRVMSPMLLDWSGRVSHIDLINIANSESA